MSPALVEAVEYDRVVEGNPTKVTVVFCLGGGKVSLQEKMAELPNTIVVSIDCEEEQRKRRERCRKLGIHQFSLASRETLETLCEQQGPEKWAMAQSVATMLAREGCGSAPMAARIAGQELFESPEFDRFFDALIEQAYCMTTGRLDLLEVIILSSYCGGVGPGTATALIVNFSERWKEFDFPLKIVADVVGPLTYLRLSELAPMNAYGTLGDFVHLATTKTDRARRISVHINLHELPPTGQDRRLKDRLLHQDAEAFLSSALQELVTQICPNHGAGHLFGNISSREADVFKPLDGVKLVLPSVADLLYGELEEKLQNLAVDSSRILERKWVAKSRELPRLSLSTLEDQLGRLSAEDFIKALRSAGRTAEYQLLFDMGDHGGEYDTAKMDRYFSTPPETATRAVDRLSQIETFLVAIDEELSRATDELESRAEEVKLLEAQIAKQYGRITNSGWGSGRRHARLLDNAVALREASDELLDLNAKIICLKRSLRGNKYEKRILEDQFTAIRGLLSKFVPRGSAAFPRGLVAVVSIDSAFRTLSNLGVLPPEDQMSALCGLARCVTLEGLAKIVGAAEPKPDAIAEQLVFGKATTVCPPHGGVTRLDCRLKAYALPPTDTAFSQELQEAILRRDPTAVVTFNDSTRSAYFGINAIRYHVRGFKSVDQLVVGTVKHAKSRIGASPTAPLRFPTGRDLMPPGGRAAIVAGRCAIAD